MQPVTTQEQPMLQALAPADENYIRALENLVQNELEAKRLIINSWQNRDKFVNDFFTFSLVTLGAAATVMSASAQLVHTKPLFLASLVVLTFVVITASVVRIYLSQKVAQANLTIYSEFTSKGSSIHLYHLYATQENKGRMETTIGQSNILAESWITRYAPNVIVIAYVVSFLSFALSLLFDIKLVF